VLRPVFDSYHLQERSNRPFSKWKRAWNALFLWSEGTERLPVAAITCTGIPILVVLAHLRWRKVLRQELPRWRSGLGLASMVIVSVLWLFQTTRWIALSMNGELTTSYGSWKEFELFLPAFYAYPGLPLAFALKGTARLQMVVAWSLLGIFYDAFWYT
jgi:hypothetical protein